MCYRTGKYTVCRCVRASFSPEITWWGSEGVNIRRKNSRTAIYCFSALNNSLGIIITSVPLSDGYQGRPMKSIKPSRPGCVFNLTVSTRRDIRQINPKQDNVCPSLTWLTQTNNCFASRWLEGAEQDVYSLHLIIRPHSIARWIIVKPRYEANWRHSWGTVPFATSSCAGRVLNGIL